MGFNIGLILIAVLNLLACSILAIAHDWNLGLVVVFAGLPPLVGAGFLKIRLDARLDRDTSKRYSASAAVASDRAGIKKPQDSMAPLAGLRNGR